MSQNNQELNTSRKEENSDFWDIIIALRLYLILLFIILPVILLVKQLKYVQPLGIIILGFSALLILRFVLFEPRKQSIKYQMFSLALLIPCGCLIFFNFVLALIKQIIHMNLTGIILPLFICIGSVVFFFFTVPKKRFKALNARLISWKVQWSSRGKYTQIKRHAIAFGCISWLLVSTLLLLVPYPIYIQRAPSNINGQRIGIWVGSGYDLPNETMEMLSDAEIYFVTTVKKDSIGIGLAEWFNRCRSFDIEVHLSISAISRGIYSFVNIWTIEDLTEDIDIVLEWINESGYLEDPVSTVVYDMEGLGELSLFEFLLHREANSKLSEYYRMKKLFNDFNQHIRDDYGLDVQICGEFVQGFDPNDGDDDIISLNGLISDDEASMSYMIYRKDVFGLNYVFDCCKLFNERDTIIINSWKFEGCLCWEDLDCVIEEARLVLGYPGKRFNLELWRIDNFLDSYGLEGLHDFVEAITEDPSDWPVIYVWYRFPHSMYINFAFLLFSILDLYAPILKIIFINIV